MEHFKIENLSFSYPTSQNKSLDDVSLRKEKGEYIVLCGKSGSGKSTLARKIAAETGAIHIEPDMFCIQDAEYRYNPEKDAKAFDNARAIISRLAYNMECDIIFADVLPQIGQVDSFRYLIPSNYKIVVQDLHITKEESLKRNKHIVRPEDIEAMAGAWQNWNNQEVK